MTMRMLILQRPPIPNPPFFQLLCDNLLIHPLQNPQLIPRHLQILIFDRPLGYFRILLFLVQFPNFSVNFQRFKRGHVPRLLVHFPIQRRLPQFHFHPNSLNLGSHAKTIPPRRLHVHGMFPRFPRQQPLRIPPPGSRPFVLNGMRLLIHLQIYEIVPGKSSAHHPHFGLHLRPDVIVIQIRFSVDLPFQFLSSDRLVVLRRIGLFSAIFFVIVVFEIGFVGIGFEIQHLFDFDGMNSLFVAFPPLEHGGALPSVTLEELLQFHAHFGFVAAVVSFGYGRRGDGTFEGDGRFHFFAFHDEDGGGEVFAGLVDAFVEAFFLAVGDGVRDGGVGSFVGFGCGERGVWEEEGE
mmetsp:Transcript_8368/g.16895  ORF Transcript_8368/g.16895 Transcript_8368/m.16895 type:complete len:350 (+) Transcript_8368:282-1331(+)